MTNAEITSCVDRLVSIFKISLELFESIRASEEEQVTELVESPAQLKLRIRGELFLLRALEDGANEIQERHNDYVKELGEAFSRGDSTARDALFEHMVESEFIKRSLQNAKNRGVSLAKPAMVQEQAEKARTDILAVLDSLHERIIATRGGLAGAGFTGTGIAITSSSRRPSSAILDSAELDQLNQLSLKGRPVITPPHTPGEQSKQFSPNPAAWQQPDNRSSRSSMENRSVLVSPVSYAVPLQAPAQQQQSQVNGWPLALNVPSEHRVPSKANSTSTRGKRVSLVSGYTDESDVTSNSGQGDKYKSALTDSNPKQTAAKRGGFFGLGKKSKENGKESSMAEEKRDSGSSNGEQNPPQSGSFSAMRGMPHESNNYWGFCKGAWLIQSVEPGKAFKVRKHMITVHAKIGYVDCTACQFTGRHFGQLAAAATPDPTVITAECGIKYKWVFLAKSHKECKDKDARILPPNLISSTSNIAIEDARRQQELRRRLTMVLGCLFCCADDRNSQSYVGAEKLMLHILEEHGPSSATPMREDTRRKLGCVIGPVSPADQFDINLPLPVRRVPMQNGSIMESQPEHEAVELDSLSITRSNTAGARSSSSSSGIASARMPMQPHHVPPPPPRAPASIRSVSSVYSDSSVPQTYQTSFLNTSLDSSSTLNLPPQLPPLPNVPSRISVAPIFVSIPSTESTALSTTPLKNTPPDRSTSLMPLAPPSSPPPAMPPPPIPKAVGSDDSPTEAHPNGFSRPTTPSGTRAQFSPGGNGYSLFPQPKRKQSAGRATQLASMSLS